MTLSPTPTVIRVVSFLLGWIPNVLADTFEVTDTPQLRQALAAAQSNGQDDVIVLADGIYSTSADGLGPFQFLDDESFSLSLVAENEGQAVLDGEQANRVLDLDSTDQTSQLYLKEHPLNGLRQRKVRLPRRELIDRRLNEDAF